MTGSHEELRRRIGVTVRRLRKHKHWTLAELAKRLALSESRLSEIERGQGSFSAEQLLVLFQLFQLGPQDFTGPDDRADPTIGSLQNALVRFGAWHLTTDEHFAIRTEHQDPGRVVEDVLIRHPTARFLTALPPVLIDSHGAYRFPTVQDAVVRAGVPNRWGWLLEHVLAALDDMGRSPASIRWRRDSQRLKTHAAHFLQTVPRPDEDAPVDLIDPDFRSRASVAAAEADASEVDRRWRVLSRLTTEDFVKPLEFARDAL